MTDIYGATPSNIAAQLLEPGRVEGIAGVNMPMLIRALTYRDEPLETVVVKALSGGTEGMTRMPAKAESAPPVQKQTVTIVNKLGLHAGPRQAHPDRREIRLRRPPLPQRQARERQEHHGRDDARGRNRVAVEIETDGQEEEQAMAALVKLFADKFGEGE